MAKQRVDGGRGRRPGVVTEAKRGGPGRGFWLALGIVAVIGHRGAGLRRQPPEGHRADDRSESPAHEGGGVSDRQPDRAARGHRVRRLRVPGCGQFATITEPDVRDEAGQHGEDPRRYIDFPLPMHKNTWDASLAAACANDQGKFWEMHDVIFQNQDRWNGEATSRPRPVSPIWRRGSASTCRSTTPAWMPTRTARKIQAHLQEAERRDVNQTPTFVIGDKMVPGALPYDTFKKLVDDELAKAPARTDSAAKPAAAPRPTARDEEGGREVNKRMLVALVALAGVFVALYLTLYKLGYIGTLACAVGSCETVQTSKWATFLGIPGRRVGRGLLPRRPRAGLVGLTPRYADTRRALGDPGRR